MLYSLQLLQTLSQAGTLAKGKKWTACTPWPGALPGSSSHTHVGSFLPYTMAHGFCISHLLAVSFMQLVDPPAACPPLLPPPAVHSIPFSDMCRRQLCHYFPLRLHGRRRVPLSIQSVLSVSSVPRGLWLCTLSPSPPRAADTLPVKPRSHYRCTCWQEVVR